MTRSFNRLVARIPAAPDQRWHPWFVDVLLGRDANEALDLEPGKPFRSGAVIKAVEIVEDGAAMMVTAYEYDGSPA